MSAPSSEIIAGCLVAFLTICLCCLMVCHSKKAKKKGAPLCDHVKELANLALTPSNGTVADLPPLITAPPPDTGERSLSKAAPSLQSSRRNLRRSELSRMNLPLSSPAQASSSSLLNPDALTTKRDTRSASPKTMARNASAFASLGATFARTPDQAEIPNFRSLQTSQSRLPASRSSPTPLNANATTSQGHLTFDIKEQPGLPFPSMGSLTPATPITRTAKPSDDHIRITATQRKPVTWT
eukprot:TRINITY_DN27555_c0_g1_i1.p1 TRINITY_DN27555_c0_g1~~TRINITY_DN27555_c0_g1_i1.p1  ORF type:complete len:275 (+),score=19.48 TRINITY_DN27555_c0_g1_i1:107-826(+)